MKNLNHRNGFMALMAVLILGGGALLLALASSSLGLTELELSTLDEKAGRALAAADGCLDEALRRLRFNAGLVWSNQLLTIGEASCIITISSGNPKVITATSTVGNINKKIQATATVAVIGGSNVVVLNAWSERAN